MWDTNMVEKNLVSRSDAEIEERLDFLYAEAQRVANSSGKYFSDTNLFDGDPDDPWQWIFPLEHEMDRRDAQARKVLR